ncbi:hypothetical protein B0H67DRAFT_647390 [Lasiosphaeris hirsuta]|uniref:Uncharacterized protein n=1 Tax=Lasiosphaeris hirsuta TaxID=260670 RepID=A0AA40DSV1_9PEZI|nr:hypothetical protein B0H67DRAFT_647390 [Lasiosphaeris hirsuta]
MALEIDVKLWRATAAALVMARMCVTSDYQMPTLAFWIVYLFYATLCERCAFVNKSKLIMRSQWHFVRMAEWHDFWTRKEFIAKHHLEALYPPAPESAKSAHTDMCTILLSSSHAHKIFPCIYTTKGLKPSDQCFCFLPTQHHPPRRLCLTSIPHLSRTCAPNTSLVILCHLSDPIRSVEEYNLDFWAFLHGLRVLEVPPLASPTQV